MTIDDSRESAPMSREEVIETLKTMVFGVQAFKRFNAKERKTLNKAWNMINQCDKCENGNPCLYCKHEFEPQERSDKE